MATKTSSKLSKNGNNLDTPAFQRKGKSTPAASQPSQVADASAPKGETSKPPNSIRMPSINDVRLVGRLTADPIVRDAGGRNVANFSVASERPYLDANKKWQKQVAFVPCSAWGSVADRSKDILKKGSPVYLEGRLRSNSWEGKDGVKRSEVRLEAYKIQSLAKNQSMGQDQGMSR
jgi:single-strand DNA-binding protein